MKGLVRTMKCFLKFRQVQNTLGKKKSHTVISRSWFCCKCKPVVSKEELNACLICSLTKPFVSFSQYQVLSYCQVLAWFGCLVYLGFLEVVFQRNLIVLSLVCIIFTKFPWSGVFLQMYRDFCLSMVRNKLSPISP